MQRLRRNRETAGNGYPAQLLPLLEQIAFADRDTEFIKLIDASLLFAQTGWRQQEQHNQQQGNLLFHRPFLPWTPMLATLASLCINGSPHRPYDTTFANIRQQRVAILLLLLYTFLVNISILYM